METMLLGDKMGGAKALEWDSSTLWSPKTSPARRSRRWPTINGPAFVARKLLNWIVDQGIETALIEPSKPWQNGATESFNGKFRVERLSLEWCRSPGRDVHEANAIGSDYAGPLSSEVAHVANSRRFGCHL